MFKEFPVIALSERELFPGFCPDHFLACAHQKQVLVKVTPEDSTNTHRRLLARLGLIKRMRVELFLTTH